MASYTFSQTPSLTISQKEQNLAPSQFIWPKEDLVQAEQELDAPIIDLARFLSSDKAASATTAERVRAACMDHGFFQVTNHGVDEAVIQAAHDHIDKLFDLPTKEKLRLRRQRGSAWGYSGAHADRFSKNLPWKETSSFKFDHASGADEKIVVDYFNSVLGKDFIRTGLVYQIYCEQMKKLAMTIFELLEVSLGVEGEQYYRKLFEEGNSIMRCNYYPKCDNPKLVLGTGPHADPTTITILHQDQVGGLEVFSENKWKSVRPYPNAFVVNIGDTFMALSNGKYKSCMHRAVVNNKRTRRSMVYFVCPKEDLILRAPEKIVENDGEKRKYPDFKWAELYDYTQNHYRVDDLTLTNFFRWLHPSPANYATSHPSPPPPPPPCIGYALSQLFMLM